MTKAGPVASSTYAQLEELANLLADHVFWILYHMYMKQQQYIPSSEFSKVIRTSPKTYSAITLLSHTAPSTTSKNKSPDATVLHTASVTCLKDQGSRTEGRRLEMCKRARMSRSNRRSRGKVNTCTMAQRWAVSLRKIRGQATGTNLAAGPYFHFWF